jgi:hypothetical protein
MTALCHYAERHCGECLILFIIMLNVVLLSFVVLSVVAPLQQINLNETMNNDIKTTLNLPIHFVNEESFKLIIYNLEYNFRHRYTQ